MTGLEEGEGELPGEPPCYLTGERSETASHRQLDQVLLERRARGGRTGGDPELAIDRGQVPVDGATSDDQLLGDLCVVEDLVQHEYHVQLAGRQCDRPEA